jgi:signal transduction histidine kinase
VGGTVDVDVEPATVHGSEGLLRQALWNLLDNAMKYRKPDFPIVIGIRGRVAAGAYELSVSDNGIGMSEDDARNACEPFYRAFRSHETPGTGLGLSIVKRVVEASGGSVTVTSKIDEGTSFTMALSLADSVAAQSSRPPRAERRAVFS